MLCQKTQNASHMILIVTDYVLKILIVQMSSVNTHCSFDNFAVFFQNNITMINAKRHTIK